MLPIRAVSGGWRHRPADFLGKCCHVSIDRIDRRGFIRRWAATKFSPFAANSSCNVEQFPWQERRSRHGRLDQLAQATIIRMPACSRLRRFSMGLDGFGANACGMNLSFYRLKSAERSRRSARSLSMPTNAEDSFLPGLRGPALAGRSTPRPTASLALRAVGVALPPTVREADAG